MIILAVVGGMLLLGLLVCGGMAAIFALRTGPQPPEGPVARDAVPEAADSRKGMGTTVDGPKRT